MPDPILQLTVTKGPRKGESLQCQPGTLTRIGRVIKGNAFAVRDKGASQSHLSFEFLPSSSRWAVSDIGSSNGTILNGASVPAGAAVPVADGDEIKIGESTIISVKIVEAEVAVEGNRRPLTRASTKNEQSLRGRKPRGNWNKVENEMMEFKEEEMEWVPPKSGRPLRGRKPKVDSERNVGKGKEVIKEEEKEKIVNHLVVEQEVVDKEEKSVIDLVEEKEEPEKGKKLSGRNPKVMCNLMNGKENGKIVDDAEKEKIVQDSEEEEEQPRKVRQLRGTKLKKAPKCLDRLLKEKDGEKEKVLNDGEREKVVEDSEADENEEQAHKGRQLRSRKQELPKSANASEKEKSFQDPEVDEEEQPRKERLVRGRKPKMVPKLANGFTEEKNAEKGKASNDCEGGQSVEEEGKMGVEDGEAEVKGVAEDSEEVGDEWVNMTLGEWFDRMEKFLPQVINDMAEEIIAELREKARQFDEYVAKDANLA